MSCRGIRKSLLGYADGTLPGEEREAVRRHIESCPSCALAAGKLELSGRALGSVGPAAPGDRASGRVLAAVMSGLEGEPGGRAGGFSRLLRSRQALAVGAAAAAVIVAVSVFVAVGLDRGGRSGTTELEERAAGDAASGTASELAAPAAAEQRKEAAGPEGAVSQGPPPLPLVTATANDYTPDSLRAMVESLPVRGQFAERYSLADAAVLGPTFAKKAADEAAAQGIDGPELEAMISYVTSGEPALLPCYVEKASFGGREAWIIGFSAPPRTGDSVKLSRTEFWVLDPVMFTQNPDGSILFFLEYK